MKEASHEKINTLCFHLHDVSEVVNIREAENRCQGLREGKLVFTGDTVSILQDGKGPRALLNNSVNMLNATLKNS